MIIWVKISYVVMEFGLGLGRRDTRIYAIYWPSHSTETKLGLATDNKFVQQRDGIGAYYFLP